MRRTASRSLAARPASAAEAFAFGVALSVAGGVWLWVAVNGLSALLAVSTLLSYLLVTHL